MPLRRTFSDLVSDSRRRNDELDVQELAERMDADEPGLIVIDIREDNELAGGFIPGSIHIGRGVLERDIEKKAFGGTTGDKDLARPIVLYCAGGNRSLLAADSLKQMGFTNVLSLIGGFRAWAATGKDVVFPTRVI
jgi:rhodanese-related sulfurtransferase